MSYVFGIWPGSSDQVNRPMTMIVDAPERLGRFSSRTLTGHQSRYDKGGGHNSDVA